MHRPELVDIGKNRTGAHRPGLVELVAQERVQPDQPAAGPAQPVHLGGEARAALEWALRAADAIEAADGRAEQLRLLRRAVELLPEVPGLPDAEGRLDELLRRERSVAADAGATFDELEAVEALLARLDPEAEPLVASELVVRRMHLRFMAGKAFIDLDQTRERWVEKPMDWLTAFHAAPDGSRVVLTARGKVFAAPHRQGRLVQVTREDGVRWREARFLDAKSVVALSDASGEVEVWRLPANGVGEPKRLTKGGSVLRWEAIPSPDGKRLAFVKRLPGLVSAIYLMDLATGKEWSVYDRFDRDLQETSGAHGNAPLFAWTPDAGSLVFWSGGQFHRLDVTTKQAATIPVHLKTTMKIQPAVRFVRHGGVVGGQVVGLGGGRAAHGGVVEHAVVVFKQALLHDVRAIRWPGADDELARVRAQQLGAGRAAGHDAQRDARRGAAQAGCQRGQ